MSGDGRDTHNHLQLIAGELDDADVSASTPAALDALERRRVEAEAANDDVEEMTALAQLVALALEQDELQRGLQALQRYQLLADRNRQPHLLAVALGNAGVAHRRLGDYAAAVTCYGRQLELVRALGDLHGLSVVLNNAGALYDRIGQHAKAETCHAEALTRCDALGDDEGAAIAMHNLASARRGQSDAKGAESWARQAVQRLAELAWTETRLRCWYGLVELLLERGAVAEARALLEETSAATEVEPGREVAFRGALLHAQLLLHDNQAAGVAALDAAVTRFPETERVAELLCARYAAAHDAGDRARARGLLLALQQRTPDSHLQRLLERLDGVPAED